MEYEDLTMSDSAWESEVGEGVRLLRRPVGGWVVSPDDQFIAWWEAEQGGLQIVRCAEIATGREVLRASGKPVGGAVWVSNEALWVIRQEPQGFNVIAHAIPDGGVMHAVRHQGLQNSSYRVERSRDGNTVMVAPKRWHLGDRKAVRTRPIMVLRGPLAELVGSIDIDRVEQFERKDGGCNGGVAALSPDGDRVAIGYDGVVGESKGVKPTGVAVVSAVGMDRSRVAVSGAKDGLGLAINDIRWVGPARVVISVEKPEATGFIQDVRVVSLDSSLKGHQYGFGVAQAKSWVRDLLVDISQDQQRMLVSDSKEVSAVSEVDLDNGGRKTLMEQSQLFGAHWGIEPGEIVVGSRVKQYASVSVVEPDMRVVPKGAVKLDGKRVEALSLSRSPGSRYAVVYWRKLGAEALGGRVALVSMD